MGLPRCSATALQCDVQIAKWIGMKILKNREWETRSVGNVHTALPQSSDCCGHEKTTMEAMRPRRHHNDSQSITSITSSTGFLIGNVVAVIRVPSMS